MLQQPSHTPRQPRLLCVLLRTLFLLLCSKMAVCDLDKGYCSKYITNIPTSDSGFTLPKFRDNFMAVIERKLFYNHNYTNQVTNTLMYFSQSNDVAKLVLDRLDDVYTAWALGKRNTLIFLNSVPIDQQCQGVPLSQSPIGQFLLAAGGDNNDTVFGPPSAVLQFSKGMEYYNFSQATVLPDRGINVNKVKTCTYHAATDATSVADVYFSDVSKTKMPGDPQTAVIVRVDVQGINHHFEPTSEPYNYSIRYDYTHFDYGITPGKSDVFKFDNSDYCKFPDKNNAKVIPEVKDTFHIHLEVLTRTNYGGSKETQSLQRNILTYDKNLNLFVEETIQASTGTNNLIQTEHDILVNDFTTGVQFTVDRIRGQCKNSSIDRGNIDVVNLHRFVRMKTVKEFFNLDNYKYQYIGEQTARSIDCDAWRTVYGKDNKDHIPNAIYTIYFATEAWKAHYRKELVGTAVPVQMDIEQKFDPDTQTGGVFYRYSFSQFEVATPFKPVPELSLCFTSDYTFNLQFAVKGDLYYIVTPDAPAFRRAVMDALLVFGGIESASRISRVDYFPWNRKEILVVFTLLDFSGIRGDVAEPLKEPSNSDVLNSLKGIIDAGKFTFEIQRLQKGNIQKVRTMAIPLTLQEFAPNEGIPTPPPPTCAGTGPATKPYTGPPTQPYTGPPTQPYTGPPTQPYTGAPTVKPTGSQYGGGDSGSDSGYGPGDMAGLAFGMIIISVLLTLAAGFLYIRYRGTPQLGSGIAMSKLSSDP